MGSMLARDYLTKHGSTFQAVALSGTSAPTGVLAKVGALIARAERFRLGARGRSKLLETMSTGEYNRAFRPNRTDHDWLSRDNAQVDLYIADPRCGFDFTVQGWIDILHGVVRIEDPSLIVSIPHDLPMLLMSGSRDPLGKNGVGIEKVATMFRAAGLRKVEVKLYPEARHEIFNETNRAEVLADLVAWFDKQLAA
jgi:alpha-beta hydrolase superfamily lysophospholipase